MDSTSSSTTSLTNIEVDGTTYSIDLPFAGTDHIQGSIRSTGSPYELQMLRAMAATLSEGDLVLDVGANIGNHTLFLATVCGAEIVAYEPDSRLTEALTRSVQANSLGERVTVRAVAVAETAGELVLVDDVEGNLGGQHLVADSDAKGQLVPVVRLDDEMPDSTVRAMKIDVEGFELNVLEGARELIERDHPDLWIECLDADHYRSISAKIAPQGYRFNGVFNPSPTYHFVYDLHPSAENVTAAVDRAVERFYADHALFVNTRESLLAANTKYRTVTQQYVDLRDRLFDEGQAGPTVETSSLVALRQAEERSAELQVQLTHLLDEKRRIIEKSRDLEESLADEARRLRVEKKRLTRIARRRARRTRERHQAEVATVTAAVNQLAADLTDATAAGESSAKERLEADQRSKELARLAAHKDRQIADLTEKHSRYRADFNFLRDHISRTDFALEQVEANLEEQTEKCADLEGSLESTQKSLADSTRRVSDLEKRGATLIRARDTQIKLAESHAHRALSETVEREALQGELASAKNQQRILTRARDAQRSMVDELRETLAERDDALQRTSEEGAGHRARADALEVKLAEASTALSQLRGSRTYRAGKAWRDAATWSGFWLLVPRLMKIAFERSH
ncbi:FkbM family methyltransferase [uncultured Brachybacterium sp.]|uniref:FkbM family methyltransferase n=1 Tax=uncultured Brachybacterium sp. TaxID=189680 RepID=UPI00262472CE|nr:FkbM family methyltransferase [uncultured Brachybacterium sp.]